MTKANLLPSLQRIKELLHYDHESGCFFWKQNKGKFLAGSKAGTICKGYVAIKIDYKIYAAHRIAWFLLTGEDPMNKHIDHIDNDRSNNRPWNLRLATNSQNMFNQPAPQSNTSGFKGVSYRKTRRKWIATIQKDGKQHFLGHFNTPELAHMAYCKAAAELHGEFARGQ
jgi:hypothetical protein